jgi:nucleoside-diphosphate-sugar epimerase
MQKNSRIYVAGHRGLVGSALVRALQRRGYSNLITRTHAELDLTDRMAVRRWGAYTVIEEAPGFKIKRIELNPGGHLGLQSHERQSDDHYGR